MNEIEFKDRTKKLGLRIIKLVEALPNTSTGQVVGKQLIRCGTSVGANYRAACRGKSPADMLNKLAIVEEEADEVLYWLEIIIEAGLMPQARVNNLITETDEILSMVVASIRTLKGKK
jgi:four helix bundle protein